MHKKIIATVLICCLFITGCSGISQKRYENRITIEDSTGAIVTVPINPKRVAVLFSSFADIWVTAGGIVDITIPETVERGFATDNVILVGDGAGKTIDLERLIAAEPDFVICSADIKAQLEAAEVCRLAGKGR